jgi:transposase
MVDQSDDLRRPSGPRIEVFAGAGRRRWDEALKAQIVAESFEPGAVVTQVARRHGCRAQQVHDWRRLARQGLLALPSVAPAPEAPLPEAPLFVPLLPEPAAASPSSPAKPVDDIVVEWEDVLVRVRGRPGRDALGDVFAALRRTRTC